MTSLKEKSKKIQIYILSYNRIEYLKFVLDSVLAQSFKDYTVILSDNSNNSIIENYIKSNYSNEERLIYKRRIPSLSAHEHFVKVFSEVDSEYFMVFHDDDIMEIDCLKTLLFHLENNDELVACSGNAIMFLDDNKKFRKKFLHSDKEIYISNPEELAKRYLLFGNIAPYPLYLYKREKIKGILPGENEGKYSDVTLMLNILKRGKILWDPKVLMYYRKHFNQDSHFTRIHHAKKLMNFICNNTSISKKSNEIYFYRMKILANKIKIIEINFSNSKIKKRYLFILKKILCYSPFNIFLRLILWKLFYKINLLLKKNYINFIF